jgi:hypothetical protein
MVSRRGARSQAGQAFVLVGIIVTALLSGIGFALDATYDYYWTVGAGRAASAAALSGVVFMPNQLLPSQAVPAGSGNDATDRAVAEARRNGFDVADTANNVKVTATAVAGATNELQVVVSRTVPTLFMRTFGIQTFGVSRTSVAQYLPPIGLGQSGNQIGYRVSDLGSTGFFTAFTEGSAVDRSNGDAYTPANNGAGCSACPSTDVHSLSQTAGTDLADPGLPARGGYNYRLYVPSGTALVQVYNAAFAPDNNSIAGPNYCENAKTGTAGHTCSSGGNYYLHESDLFPGSATYSTASNFSAMEYTLFSDPNQFTPSSDTKLSQMIVDPLDARNWNLATPTYLDVRKAKTITQKYNGSGAATDALQYHAWLDVASHAIIANDQGSISYTPGYGPLAGALGPGYYRLRIDTLEGNASNPPSNGSAGSSIAAKSFAIRMLDPTTGNLCAGCTLSAIDDIGLFTNIALPIGGSFQIPLFQLPPDYAGKTISVNIFDAGDMSGAGNIYVGFVNPQTNALLDLGGTGTTATVWNLGYQLSNYGTSSASVVANPTVVEQLVTSGINYYAAQNWYTFDIPIPSSYAPGANPNNWWWKFQYRATGSVTAHDVFTITVGLKGNPAHLLSG